MPYLRLCFLAVLILSNRAAAQAPPDAAPLLAAQRAAMEKVSFLDGEWRGTAWTLLPDGRRHTLVQTERVGSMLDGTVKLIEGRGYEDDGGLGFNAVAVLSYDPAANEYRMRSYAQGRAGDFGFMARDDGFVWEIPAGPALIRYEATVRDGVWREVGDRLVPGQPPMRIYEMTVTRVGDTDWPAAGAVRPE